MAETAINTDLETRALLSEQADAASIPRARFVAILAKRYGWRQVEDLTEPARVVPITPEQDPQPGGIITAECSACGWKDKGLVHEVREVAREHHEKTGHLVGPYGSDGPASRKWVDEQAEEAG